MKKLLLVVMAALTTISCGGGGGGAPLSTPPVTTNPPAAGPTAAEQLATDLEGLALGDFYEVSYGALISRSPESVVSLALTNLFPPDEIRLNDLSDSFSRDTFAMHQVVLDGLQRFDQATLSVAEQLTYDVYESLLRDVVDQLDFIYYDFPATFSLFGVQRDTETFFTNNHPLQTREDADNYITRLNGVAIKFSQLSDHLNRQRDAGIIEPALTMQVAIDQMAGIAGGNVDNNPYFSRLRDKLGDIPGLTDADRQSLLDAARTATSDSVIPGYQQLRQTLQGLQSNASQSIGVGQFSRGSDYYAYILRHHTTTDMSAAEIHQLGLVELQRIHAEMRLIFDDLGYPQNESLPQLFARVSTDGGIVPAADALAAYESIIDTAEQRLDQAFDIFPSADVIVAPDDFGGFYIGPSFDGARPGAFFAGTTTDQARYEMPSLTYHEAVPGHHMQIALAMEQDAPTFRKVERVTAFVEGWALYAERLAYELGWYDNDRFGNLGRLQFEALRAARLVIDTGIHSLGWSFDQAVQFNADNVGASTRSSQSAAARYSVIPGQATAYMVGMLHILAARQRAMDDLGAEFDLKEFHGVVLSAGGVPMPLLDTVVDDYVAGYLASSPASVAMGAMR